MPDNRMKLPLFDDYWIDFRIGTVRRWFSPQLWSSSGPQGAYSSLVCDREKGIYRIFYEYCPDIGNDDVRFLKLCESRDLIEFTPVHADDGSDIVFSGGSGIHGATVLLDTHEKDPSRRYKFCGMTETGSGDSSKYKVTLAFSPDGVHWEERRDLVANPYTSDALNKLYYNPLMKEYVLLHRSAFVDRRISVRSSEDLAHWSRPHIILQPGPNYNDGYTGMQHYSMTAGWFDGIFYGLVWRFNTCLYDREFSRMYGFMEPELVYSYDGREYLYTSGKPLVERPYPPEPGCMGISPMDMCESLDGQDYYLLMNGTRFFHGTAATNKVLADRLGITGGSSELIYKIRKDGFCGIESPEPGGQVITKCLAFDKDDLVFNVRADVGSVRFGLMDRAGKFLPGFTFDDCIPFEYASSVSARAQWKEHSISEILGRQVRIAVELNSAILHCISATAHPYIRQPMRSFADPEGYSD